MIDFREARLLDATWWRRLNLLLDEVSTDDTLRLAETAFFYHMLTAANANLNADGFKSSREAAYGMFHTMDSALRPWAVDRKPGVVEKDVYSRAIGDYENDPAFRQIVEAEAKAMRDAALAGPDRTDEQTAEDVLTARLRAQQDRRQREQSRRDQARRRRR